MVGVDEPPVEESSLAFFEDDTVLNKIPVHETSKFDLIPYSGNLVNAARRLNKPTDVFWIKEALDVAHPYDVILIDTAAAVTVYSLNALVAGRHVLVPVVPEYQPVVGAEQTYQTCQLVRENLNPELKDPYFLFTQVDGRKRSHQQYQQYIRNIYESRVLNNVIRTSTSLSETEADGTTIFDHDISSRGARDYANVTDELLQRMGIAPPQNGRSTSEAVPSSSVARSTD
jgi:chromosome partitioning protein